MTFAASIDAPGYSVTVPEPLTGAETEATLIVHGNATAAGQYTLTATATDTVGGEVVSQSAVSLVGGGAVMLGVVECSDAVTCGGSGQCNGADAPYDGADFACECDEGLMTVIGDRPVQCTQLVADVQPTVTCPASFAIDTASGSASYPSTLTAEDFGADATYTAEDEGVLSLQTEIVRSDGALLGADFAAGTVTTVQFTATNLGLSDTCTMAVTAFGVATVGFNANGTLNFPLNGGAG